MSQATLLAVNIGARLPAMQNKTPHFIFIVKEQTMKHTIYDILTAVAIGLLLTVGALAYFDILWS
jgi:hypothetical protein